MIRRFLTSRWVTIHLLTISILVIFALFGRWQLHRWEDRGTSVEPPDPRPAVELASLVSPDEPVPGGSIGRRTTATGTYDGAHQVLVAGRQLDGRNGWWLVTPLRTADAAPAALVVRGWVADPTTPAPPAGPVTVAGRLYASEDLPPVGAGGRSPLPPGRYGQVNTAELTAAFPYRILDGYVLRAGTTTPTGATVAGEPTAVPAPVRVVDEGGGLRNLAYALQWWLFAGAVLYFWWKLVRDDLRPPAERVYEPAQTTARQPVDRVPAAVGGGSEPARAGPFAGPSADATGDVEDEELAAYNRYLAALSRGGRPRS